MTAQKVTPVMLFNELDHGLARLNWQDKFSQPTLRFLFIEQSAHGIIARERSNGCTCTWLLSPESLRELRSEHIMLFVLFLGDQCLCRATKCQVITACAGLNESEEQV
ncbi:hypothetical protein [Raineyella sp. LH-20]|uniref:hypothetical protein n=1 Tax=Raineyella sp. LH-20 TaxID=3081204 RepID=UPI0029553861|nr:hypothetical protein [Raineyella sp. LH-20]WOP20309.1 hypothetical protein R0146_08745 [Raineyella sp. LH-20]